MKYSELISCEKKYGECKNDLLIIIPCFINYDVLVKHLGYLSKQTFQKFDVVIVLGPDFDDANLSNFLDRSKFNFGIIIIKRKEDTGSAGGFFTGQKYGMENNYPYMINADDDCMPVDPHLVEALYSKRDAGYVFPTQNTIIEKDRKTKMNPPCVAQYTFFSRAIFEKYGMCYAPLYCGGEDSEFAKRIEGEQYCIIPNVTEHPYNHVGKAVLTGSSKHWIYGISHMMVIGKIDTSYLIGLLFFGILVSLSLFFIPMYGPGLFVALNSLLFSYKFGQEAYSKVGRSIKQTILQKSKIHTDNMIEYTDICYLEKDSKAKILILINKCLPFFRKDILITKSHIYPWDIFALSCICRTLYFKMDDGSYMLISNNINIIVHITKLLLFPLFAVSYICFLLILFIPLKLLKQPRTIGYGLE